MIELGVSFVYLLSQVDSERKPFVISEVLQLWSAELARLRKQLAGYMELLVECPGAADRIS
jgi:hypothetical protein